MQIRCSAPEKLKIGIDIWEIDTTWCFLDTSTSENIEEKSQILANSNFKSSIKIWAGIDLRIVEFKLE